MYESFKDWDSVSGKSLEEQLDELSRMVVDNPISGSDILYLFDRWPFLQIVNADYASYGEPTFEVKRLDCGWDLQYFGDAMSASPGRFLFGKRRSEYTDEDDETGGGTIVNQAVSAAYQMIQWAKEFGWGGVLLVDGHPLMQWAAWANSLNLGLPFDGYVPEPQDYEKRKRANLTASDIDDIYRRIKMQRV